MQVAAAGQLPEWAKSPTSASSTQPDRHYILTGFVFFFCFFLQPNGVRCLWWAVATRSVGHFGELLAKMLAEDKANQLQHMQTLAALALVAVGVIFQLFLTMLEGGKNNKIIIIVFSAF